MKVSYLFREVYYALMSNKVRSFLTILGIVIGIGSVIAMISVGQGSKNSIESSIESLGSNLILVTPGIRRVNGINQGRGAMQTLTQEDADAIKNEIDLVDSIDTEVSGRYQVIAKGTNTNTQVMGTTSSYQDIRNIEIAEGNFISNQNVDSNAKVAVIGPNVRDDLFGEDAINVVGQTIRINRINFKVIGITKAKGGNGFSSQDDMIFIPITTAQKVLMGTKYINTIAIKAKDKNTMSQLQNEVTNILLERHKISDASLADFIVVNQADILATASLITDTFTTLLGSIAAISLLVGGIGIMNMMLTTVTERTREIGLRKAIGAKRRDINNQFLMEAVALTFFGGLFGIMLGWLLSLAISKFGGIPTSISTSSILLAFGVSALIGILFGYYPANRASKLNPIEALRYE